VIPVYIIGGARTPFGRFRGVLAPLSAVRLGEFAVTAALQRAGVEPGQIDDVIIGTVYQHGLKPNPARQIAMNSGIPVTVPSVTVNQQCASGLRAIDLAAQEIMLGHADLVVAGGAESMSNVPHLAFGLRAGVAVGPVTLEDALLSDALVDAFYGYHMGVTAENLAEAYQISRQEQDSFALASQQKVAAAMKSGRFAREIVPVEVSQRNGSSICITCDEHPKPEATIESLSRLNPAFKADGTVTAGNASGINDGAAAVVLASEGAVTRYNLPVLGRFVAGTSAGVDPSVMGIGPVYATHKALQRAGLNSKDIDIFEYNEAFAAQCLAVNRELQLPQEKINVHGGAIALGHPVGASGARILLSLLYTLQERGARYGLASLCAGGGPAIAAIVEAV
jgi:acetyl-CoA C-acetyltransferase